jgi:hypothetical protein
VKTIEIRRIVGDALCDSNTYSLPTDYSCNWQSLMLNKFIQWFIDMIPIFSCVFIMIYSAIFGNNQFMSTNNT